MTEHDEQAPDEQVPDEQLAEGGSDHTPSGDAQATPEPNVDRPEPGDDHDHATADEPVADEPVADELRESLLQMREEADRIASLETGDEQVEAAEQFAEDAGKLDEQVGAAARAADAND
jgi:hypothetical protein